MIINNKHHLWLYLFVLPSMIIIIIGLFYPLLYSVYASFFDWRLGEFLSEANFIGFSNYQWLLEDEDIWSSWWTTLKFTFWVVILEISLGLGLALWFDTLKGAMSKLRILFMMPMMIAPLVVGLVWQYLYQAEGGLINMLLSEFNLSPVPWLSSPDWAFWSIVITDVWQWTPFVFILVLASLQSMPRSVLEVARLDGANEWNIIRFLKLPALLPVLIVIAILRAIDAFKVFEVIYIMTSGGPAGETEVLSMAIYNQAFSSFELGRAAALSNLFLIFMALFVTVILMISHKTTEISKTNKGKSL